ncbi:MAG TPA: c-type cytochrome [Terriglobia bacterium]|nr:c-type cytochrome [Terriglobia bacterium]
MNLREKGTPAAKFRKRAGLPLALTVLSLAAWPAFAQHNVPTARPHARRAADLKPSPAVEQGQKTFESNCAFCHGEDATGGRGPDLVRSALVAHDVKGDLIGPVILNGRPNKGMPPQHLSNTQITDIAAFLHFRQMQSVASAQVPENYGLKWLLTGNAAAGKDFFNGAGGCKACHSPTGDLAHVASKYSPLDLESQMLYPRGKDRRTVSVTLPSGETIEGPLEHLDEFNVALRDPSGWYRSFPRDQVKVTVHDPLEAHRKLLGTLTQADIHNLFAYMETLK